MKKGKKYQNLVKELDIKKNNAYNLEDASEIIKKTNIANFDATIEMSVKVKYKSIQNIRGTIQLPHGTGKTVRIAVFAKGEQQLEAKDAGADVVGDVDLVEKIKGGFLDFDVAVATPEMMKDVGKLGPILGRRGLMPKPKAGTVTNNVKQAIDELRRGKIEYKADKTGVIHLGVGKASFESLKIKENITASYQGLLRDKPTDAKGDYFTSMFISTTMGPSLRINHKNITF
jgi:large subunit ribosomal protein L1